MKKVIALSIVVLLVIWVLLFSLFTEKKEIIGQARYVGFQNYNLIFETKDFFVYNSNKKNDLC